MRSADSSVSAPARQMFANATMTPARRTTAISKCDKYCSSKYPNEKRFSAACFSASHASDTARRSGIRAPARHDSESGHGFFPPPVPVAQVRARRALQRERVERHARLLAELAEREPEI